MFVDRLFVRVAIKCLVLLSAGFSGIFAQKVWGLSVALFVLSVFFQAVDYLISHRLTSLVLERITGVLEAVYTCCDFSAEADVRAAVFAQSPGRKDILRQIGRYYPTNQYSSFRRGLSTSKGIIGFCFRNQRRYLEVIRKEASFKTHLVENWGFTREEADAVKVRRSYLAIPIFDAYGRVLGVGYFDSVKEHTFTPERIDILTRGCVPLAKWIG